MSPYLVLLLILEFFLARLAMLPYRLDSNITKLLANLLTRLSIFYYFENFILYSCLNNNNYYIIIIIIYHLTNLSIILQTTELRLNGL